MRTQSVLRPVNGRNVRVIDSLDCCYHFLLVEGVQLHLSLVARTQYTTQLGVTGRLV